jgi:hypothetical protein
MLESDAPHVAEKSSSPQFVKQSQGPNAPPGSYASVREMRRDLHKRNACVGSHSCAPYQSRRSGVFRVNLLISLSPAWSRRFVTGFADIAVSLV